MNIKKRAAAQYDHRAHGALADYEEYGLRNEKWTDLSCLSVEQSGVMHRCQVLFIQIVKKYGKPGPDGKSKNRK